jgi:hypothetical protein
MYFSLFQNKQKNQIFKKVKNFLGNFLGTISAIKVSQQSKFLKKVKIQNKVGQVLNWCADPLSTAQCNSNPL